jgi:hypothetical protein
MSHSQIKQSYFTQKGTVLTLAGMTEILAIISVILSNFSPLLFIKIFTSRFPKISDC